MVSTFFLAFLFVSVLVALMAVGVLFGRKPIAGSCGGMKALGMEMECEICGGDLDKCDTASDLDAPQDLPVRATRIGD